MPKKPTKKKPMSKEQSSKDRVLIMLISIILGIGLGFGIAQATSSDDSSSTTTTTETTTPHPHTDTFNVSEEEAPKVELVVSEDAKSGYNIKVIATDFTFTPEQVNGENVLGEGHAHLYIDGEKIARLYSPYFHWDGSYEGTKEFSVTLNANDHSEYTIDGEAITATQQVTHDSSSDDHDDTHDM